MGKEIVFMIKADAYGFGSVAVASATDDIVSVFGVATVGEAVKIRQAGIKTDILVSIVTKHDFVDVVRYNLIPSISNCTMLSDYIVFAEQFVTRRQITSQECQFCNLPKLALKFDTGMHRFGFESDEVDCVIKRLSACRSISLHSIYSHLRCPNTAQLEEFDKIVSEFRHQFGFVKCHIQSSSSLDMTDRYDMVRVGLLGYSDALKLTSKVVETRFVVAGETVGYGNHILPNSGYVSLVFGGYADGINPTCPPEVIIADKTYKAFNVCMDMFFVATGDIECKIGDTVTIIDSSLGIGVEKQATVENLSEYQILTQNKGRVRKIYYEQK